MTTTKGMRHRAEQVALVAMATTGILVLVADVLGWLDGLVDSDALPKVMLLILSTVTVFLLLELGVPRQALVESRPSAATRRTIAATFDLIAAAGRSRSGDADLPLVTILRFWGEILVAVEYARMWERMAPTFTAAGGNRSRFYYPHYVHDAKAHPLASASLLSTTHSDRLATRLIDLLSRAPDSTPFEDAEEQALRLKESFYDQFRGMLDAN